MSAGARSSSTTLIIPAYNAADYLTTALASVAAQTRAFDEVIVVDDASPDESVEVASAWKSLLPLRIVHNQENLGLGATRAAGITAARTDLIALLDADDVLLPDHLHVMLSTYADHGGVICANTLKWFPGRGPRQATSRSRAAVPPSHRQPKEILRRNFGHPISLFAKADYDAVGGFRAMRKMEDWDLWLRMIRSGRFITVPKPVTALYRVHPNSLSFGHGNLEYALEVLPGYASGLQPADRRILLRGLNRRRARLDLLRGEHAAQSRRWWLAYSLWARAALRDRSLRGGLRGVDSSVTAQALADAVTAGTIARFRDTAGPPTSEAKVASRR